MLLLPDTPTSTISQRWIRRQRKGSLPSGEVGFGDSGGGPDAVALSGGGAAIADGCCRNGSKKRAKRRERKRSKSAEKLRLEMLPF